MDIRWPDRPTCHDQDYRAQQFRPGWAMPRGRVEPYFEDWRTCTYCGSIHPQDLLLALNTNKVKMGGSDWKYGWPHKFYVSIPNKLHGQLVKCGSTTYPIIKCPHCNHDVSEENRKKRPEQCPACKEEVSYYEWSVEGRKEEPNISPAPAFCHAKWYNNHLMELSDEAFAHMSTILLLHTDILFERTADGRTKWRAPRHGYQRG